MKTLVSLAIAAALATSAHAGEVAKPSWADYHSTVVNKPVNIEVDSRVDTRIDKSKKIEDSYNTNKKIEDSFNTDKSKKIHDSYNTDNSKKAVDSFNTDNSHKAVGSYNTAIDKQALDARLNSTKNIATLDTQSASNSGTLTGPTQLGFQGGFSGGNLSSTGPTTSIGAGKNSRVYLNQERDLSQSNTTVVKGPNLGAIASTNLAHMGDGDLTMGPKGSIVDSRLGNDQAFVTGDQTQLQSNEQAKQSQTSSNASDTTTVSASK